MQTTPQTARQTGRGDEGFIRVCRLCKEMFAASHRGSWYCGDTCREAGQAANRAEVKRRYASKHPERCRAAREAWRRRNPDKAHALHRAQYAAHAEQNRAARRSLYSRHAAIALGKSVFGRGFLLVRQEGPSGERWCAIALTAEDAPRRLLARGEHCVATYKQVAGHWCLFCPPTANAALRLLAARLVGQKTARGRAVQAGGAFREGGKVAT